MIGRRARASAATFLALAFSAAAIVPARAATPAVPVPITDPRVAGLIRGGCGDDAAARKPPFAIEYTAPKRLMIFGMADQAAEPSPAPSPAESASPSVAPSASPSPTAPPRLPPAPPGPTVIVPPTPRPTGTAQPTAPPPPSPTPAASPTGPVELVRPTGSPKPIPDAGAKPGPSASPVSSPSAPASPNASPGAASPRPPSPTPAPTLAPNQFAIGADDFSGILKAGEPNDMRGNVHIFYSEGQVVGDRAHYDGLRTVRVSGHTYLINRRQDAILYADAIEFDTVDNRATLIHGSGETTEGVQRGKLYYTAENLTAKSNGISHGDRATFTTCANPRGGYHISARTIDITPGDKLIARKAVVFLGPLAILYLPLLLIPLREQKDPRRQASFLPLIGYSQLEGFYVKAKIGFSPSDTYYGYYRVDYFTRRGLGLGYVAAFGTNNNRRTAAIDSYTIADKLINRRQTNINFTESENFSSRLRSQVTAQYTADFGAGISLPASVNINGTLAYTGLKSNETLTFSRFVQGSLNDTYNLGFVQQLNLAQNLSQTFNFSYSKFNSPLAQSNSLHLSSLTHYFSSIADLNLAYDKSDYSNFSNAPTYDKIPELTILPHFGFKHYPLQPFTAQFSIGEYTEPQNGFSTPRAEFVFNQPVFLKIGKSDFNATYNIRQDFYGTGDAKALDNQTASLTTPLGNHISNSVTYNETHPIGPANVPFQLFDRLSSGSHGLQDVIRFFNSDVYSLSLATSTNFNRQGQPIAYQLNARPSMRSLLVVGGSYVPGPGNGFYQTNVQALTPFGRDTMLQFSGNVDWKRRGKIVNKNIFISKIIGDCYRLDATYNQDLKQFTFNITILAFPNQTLGIGTSNGQPSSILPQNFAF